VDFVNVLIWADMLAAAGNGLAALEMIVEFRAMQELAGDEAPVLDHRPTFITSQGRAPKLFIAAYVDISLIAKWIFTIELLRVLLVDVVCGTDELIGSRLVYALSIFLAARVEVYNVAGDVNTSCRLSDTLRMYRQEARMRANVLCARSANLAARVQIRRQSASESFATYLLGMGSW